GVRAPPPWRGAASPATAAPAAGRRSRRSAGESGRGGKTVPAHGGEQASMLAGVAAFREEQALQILAQPGIGAIEMVAAGADDEAFTLGNQQGVGVEELGRQQLAAKPRAARG